jgi:carboxypeptidase family protein
MFIKSLRIAVVGLAVCVANAWASPTSFEGTVKAPDGRPIGNADVRVEARGASKFSKTVKTDAKGQYVCNGLAEGTFRVTLVVNGAVKATYNAATKLGETTQLNFALKVEAGAKAKATHMVYMPAETGSHLGGRWVEVDENGNAATAGADNVKKSSGEALGAMQHSGGH